MLQSLKVLFFCLLKSGSGVSQIQRHLNRDEFDVSRMITYYVKNQKQKTKKKGNFEQEKSRRL